MTNTRHPPYSQVSPAMAKPSIPSISQSAPVSAPNPVGSLPSLPDPPDPIKVSEWSSGGWAHNGEQLHDYGDKCYRAGMAYARSADIRAAANAARLPENWRNDVLTVYALARKKNNTIPDETLDLMREILLAVDGGQRHSDFMAGYQCGVNDEKANQFAEKCKQLAEGNKAPAADAAALPPLPEMKCLGDDVSGSQTFGFTADQMHRYAHEHADNTPWLRLAHIICADAGIPPGRIDDRLEALRDKLEADRAPATSAAALDVLAERRRQIEKEGWTPEGDDRHRSGEMAQAAACYAIKSAGLSAPAKFWPWSVHWFKGSDPRRCLVKAGALILAEIERLDRKTPAANGAAGQKGGA